MILAAVAPASVQQQPERPLDRDLTEQVEVRLVLIDALVVDGKGRIVPDLTRDDFELLVGYRPHRIDTLDLFCPAGAAEDPRPVNRAGQRADPVAPGVPRKIVLALDYMHLAQTQRPDALAGLRAIVRHTAGADDEIMVAAIAGMLRIEQGFTRDHDAVVQTLHDMEQDITLWQPPFHHEHELRFFNALTDLIELLEQIPGSKAVVLVSNHAGGTGEYDPQFRRIASRAAQARVALYPVLQIGMAPFAAAPRLARLAVESGGRFTGGTNDMSLAYARAQRDMACRYTVGFYDPRPERNRHQRVTLRVRRPGLRVIHPENYRFRGPDDEHKARVRSAHHAPELFEGGLLARFVPLEPESGRRWKGVVAVGFPLTLAPHEEAVRELNVRARRGSTIWHHSRRSFSLRSDDPALPWQGEAMLLQTVRLKPGRYHVSAVLGQPGVISPLAKGLSVDLEPVPRKRLFIVGPVPAQAAAEVAGSLEVFDAGLSPLLGAVFDRNRTMVLLGRVCFVGPASGAPAASVLTRLERPAGSSVRSTGPVSLQLEERRGPRCQTFLDRYEAGSLAPGDYTYRIRVEPPGEGQPVERAVELSVGG